MKRTQANPQVERFLSKEETSVELRARLNEVIRSLNDSIVRYVSRPSVVSNALLKADWIKLCEVMEDIHKEFELNKPFTKGKVVE